MDSLVCRLHLMTVILLTVLSLTCLHAAPSPWVFTLSDTPPTTWCRWVTAAPKVDGNLEEWSVADFSILLDQARMTGPNYANPQITGGDADCSGQVAMVWDGAFIYLAAKVRDDIPAPVDAKKAYGPPWGHDGLMVYLHAQSGLQQSGRYGDEYRRDPAIDTSALLGISYYQPAARARELPGKSQYVAKAIPGGYVLEAAIDLRALGYLQPHPGDRLKLALILVDRDPGATGNDAFGQLIWHLGPATSAGNSRDWMDLVPLRDGWGADLVGLVQEEPASGKRLRLKSKLDALRDGVIFKGVRLVNARGQSVKELPASIPVAEGKHLEAVADADAAELAAGTYTISLLTEVAGKMQVNEETTRVTVVNSALPVQLPRVAGVPDATRFVLQNRPPTLKNITKDAYLEFLKTHARPVLAANYGSSMKNPWRHAHGYGALAAYLYDQTKDPFYADVAKAALESAIGWTKVQEKEGEVHTETHWLMVKFMRSSGLLGPADEPRIKAFLTTVAARSCKGAYDWDNNPWRRGAGHSSLGPAVSRYLGVFFYPDIAGGAFFKKYFDLTWNDWWKYRDSAYNDTSYRALFLNDIFLTEYLTGSKGEIFTDPEAKKLWERLLYTTAPDGAVPHYGDTNGWGTAIGYYIFTFEYLAARTKDGRYKTAAHKVFDYLVNHSRDVHDYHFELDMMLHGVMWAHMTADDTVKEAPLGAQSRVLTRKEIVKLRPDQIKEELGWQIYNTVPGPRDVPDKIIFKSDERDESLWAMIDLCGDAEHNAPGEPLNVAALMDNEAVLTCNQGYMDEGADLHNVIFAEDLEGMRAETLEPKITLPEFYDRQRASYARGVVQNFQNWPIDVERQFFFVRNGFLLLKDRVTFNAPWLCRIGPCWQTQQISPDRGANWADTSVPSLFLTGLGTGAGCHRWINPPRDLLVYHPPQADCSLEIINRFTEQPYRVLPLRLRYVWKGMTAKGDRKHFTTLLVPHAPTPKPGELAEKIRVLADTLDVTAFCVTLPKDRQDWVLLNDTGATVKAGELETDARQVHLIVIGGKTPSRHVMATGGTFVKFNGQMIGQGITEKGMDQDF
ncbi:MAG: sugar-binding protein [Armatimonadota bacterium]